ncbi:MAG: hypothetical protein ACON4Z_09815 [Planctomycetota bacterium]
MTRPTPCSLALLLSAAAAAQSPVDPPPWWGVQDEVTVSLHWNFDNGAGALPPQAPDFVVAPSWYTNPTPWSSVGAPLQFRGQLQGAIGVFALLGAGSPQTTTLSLLVDNDPHLDWVKTFAIQYDEFTEPGSEVTCELQQQLANYGRASVTQERVLLANGYSRVTIQGALIPCPDDEGIDWLFETDGVADAAIDNVFFTTRCVKPVPDELGEALGEVTSNGGQPINMTAVTGRECRAAAVTRPPAAGAPRRLWVAAFGAAGQAHDLLEVDPVAQSVLNSFPLPTTPGASPGGPMDMTVETQFPAVGPPLEWVYTLLRTANGDLAIDAFSVTTGLFDPLRSRAIPAANVPFAPNQRLGLAFDPDGDAGRGSFWITGQTSAPPGTWRAFEFPVIGASAQPLGDIPVPAATVGFTYDATLGNFYAFGRESVARPSGGVSRVNGYEISAYDNSATGVRFCGDLRIPNPNGPDGGLAAAVSMYRTFGAPRSEARFVCIAEVGPDQFYYEVAGPYRYGYSRFGTIGMQNGPPFLGGSYDVTLRGVPDTIFAVLLLGNSPNNLPVFVEGILSLNSFGNAGISLPVGPGRFSTPLAIPANPALSYFELYSQWFVFDRTAPNNRGFSQAGKTVLYP